MVYIIVSAILEKSNRKNKKYKITLPDALPIHFGDSRYGDFIQYNNELGYEEANKKKSAYLSRHYKNENWLDPLTAGFWSRWILWNENTLDKSIKFIEKTFNIDIVKNF